MTHPSPLKSASIALLTIAVGLWSGCSKNTPTGPTWEEKVENHLQASPGGTLVLQSIEAHGGLGIWIEAEVLEFRWIYHMEDRGPKAIVNTLQRVDTQTMIAKHEAMGSDTVFGWNGSDAWIHPADANFTPPPRFWSLTPFYFVAVPFVFGDLNANFELLEAALSFEEIDYQQVKVTFNQEAGDSPDDYYIVLINPKDKRVGGVRYIVTSKIVYPDGPAPEKFITMDNPIEVGDILLPTSHRTFTMDGNTIGDHLRSAEASEYKWLKRSEADLATPVGSKTL